MAGSNNKAARGLGGAVRAGVAHLFRPGAWFRGNAFPENAIAASAIRRGDEGYNGNQKQNIARAIEDIKRQYPGLPVVKKSRSGSNSVAHVATSVNHRTGEVLGQTVVINTAASFWKNPRAEGIKMRRAGWLASASPGHVVRHELGHVKHPPTSALRRSSAPSNAGRVSRYGRTNGSEFMAETYGALRSGQRFPARVMAEYRRLQAATKPNGARNPKPQRVSPRPFLPN